MVQIVGLKTVNFPGLSRKEATKGDHEAAKVADPSGMIDRTDSIPANAVGNNKVIDVPAGSSEINFTLKKPATAATGK